MSEPHDQSPDAPAHDDRRPANPDESLSDEMLEDVAGGSWSPPIWDPPPTFPTDESIWGG